MGREYRVRDFNEMQSRQRDGAWAGVFSLPSYPLLLHPRHVEMVDEGEYGERRAVVAEHQRSHGGGDGDATVSRADDGAAHCAISRGRQPVWRPLRISRTCWALAWLDEKVVPGWGKTSEHVGGSKCYPMTWLRCHSTERALPVIASMMKIGLARFCALYKVQTG